MTPIAKNRGSELSTLTEQLLEPFPPDKISDVDGYSYVDPFHYRSRWHKVFPSGFKFHVRDVEYGKDGMAAQAYFHAETADGEFDIEVPCYENYIKASGTDTVIKREQSVNMLISAGCKAVSRELGIGLHLYEKEAKRGGSKKGGQHNNGSTTSAAPPADLKADPLWTGDEKITFGQKYKGTPWKDVDDGYLSYVTSGDKPNLLALKEIARRNGNTIGAGQTQARNAVPPSGASEDGSFEVPF